MAKRQKPIQLHLFDQEPPRTLAEALARNLNTYYPIKPCKRGHTRGRGLSRQCRECVRLRARGKMKEITARAMKWKKANPEKVAASSKRRNEKIKADPVKHEHHLAVRRANRRRLKAEGNTYDTDYARNWARRNPEKPRLNAKKQKKIYRNATPPWVKWSEIEAIHKECARITKETGIIHQVDHMVPLRGKTVCGLNAPINLRIITRDENYEKRAKLIEELLIAPTIANGLLKRDKAA